MPERKYKEAAHKLLIKYGLENEPSDLAVTLWSVRVTIRTRRGEDADTAGRAAAIETFKDFGTIKYASQADTIESLLEEIRRKEKGGR